MKEIRYGERGGGEKKGIWHPQRNTSTTHGSVPLSLQMDQRRDRQPSTLRGKGLESYLQKDYFFGVGDQRTLESKETLQRLGNEVAGHLVP